MLECLQCSAAAGEMTSFSANVCIFAAFLSNIFSKEVLKWILSIFLTFCGLLQLSYLMATSDKPESRTAGHVMLMDQSGFAYGGILNELSPTMNINDSGVAQVIKFAIQHAERNHPDTVPQNAEGKALEPSVSDLKKLKLQATKDGKTQHSLIESTFVDATKQQFQRRRVIYGITYSFCLTWTGVANPHRHTFVVSLDRQRNMYVFEHTFVREGHPASRSNSDQSAIATDEPTTSSQSECIQGGDIIAPDQSECESRTGSIWSNKRKTEAGESTDVNRPGETDTKKAKLGEHFSIVTQNIWNFNGISPGGTSADKNEAYIQRVAHLGDLIANTKADIIGFQEVRFDVNGGGHLGPCQVQQLANHLPQYQFVYQPAVNYVPDSFDRAEEGLAIFSLHPILSHDFILLSRDMNDDDDKQHQRVCLHAEIETPSNGRIHVFLTHLSLSEAARERSVVEIWNHMTKFPGPAVLIGDLNAHPQSRAIRFLQGELEINGVKTEGLQGAWLVKKTEPRVGPRAYAKDEARDEGLTFSTLNEHLSERIDYIFVRLPGNMQMTDISLVDDGGRGPMAASDHLGLKATVAGS
ncbi:uncharacterized protein LOC119739884 [Patiria miniata]|uniref:Endonuclease/exonuclease/phosphatase domain-containing protein n=1 Tax=Patiria miniata TaxID=46514 RepID=A0A914B4R9_PATMI|nr:uncharacterized protein LOC119739884 [Patiria miniata]